METFPAAAMPDWPEVVTSEYRTRITPFDSGKEHRRRRWAFPRRHLPLKYATHDQAAYEALWRFYHQMGGDYESFYFIFPSANLWPGELLAITTGVADTFDLRALSADPASVVAYLDGVVASATFISGGGQGGSDRIQFATAPSAGTVITADFVGRLRLTARFNAPSGLSRSQFEYRIYSGAIELIQVKEW
ncbi:MAG: DUF2460 domain-containing protein [Syntrophobacteraceae bacterium]